MQPVHPVWCDPGYCYVTDIDVQHRSTPTLLSTCEHKWWFTLARADEWTHAEAHGDTELLIDVHNTMLRVPDVQHVLRAQEIGLYARRLLVEHHRAQLRGASVLQDAVSASPGRRQSRESPAGQDVRANWRPTTFRLEPMGARCVVDPRRGARMDGRW
ncbi:MAG: hypothetical protein M3Y48_18095 [Actinomycetota bacterium]|nr:hypothetical protein [Actinomycetota bacterium]